MQKSYALALVLFLGACKGAREAALPPPTAAPTPKAVVGGAQAEDVVRAYYKAIDSGDYAGAYARWDGNGKASGHSLEEFRSGFSSTRATEVAIKAPAAIEGAAGSSYATVQVEVNAVQNDGTRQQFTGAYVLRRVNDVPGSSVEQRTWHLYSASLHATR